jgi:hypothetical protein
MPTVIHCTRCQRELQVYEQSLGQWVKCPYCAAAFIAQTAPAGALQPAVGPAPAPPSAPAGPPPEEVFRLPLPPEEEGQVLHGWQQRVAAQKHARPLITPPAIALLLVGILGVVANSILLLRAMLLFVTTPAGSVVNADRGLLAFVIYVGCTFLSGVVIYGASEMRNMRSSYGMAVATSIVAMTILTPGCFLLGIPAGIWSLRVLRQPEVKAAFR